MEYVKQLEKGQFYRFDKCKQLYQCVSNNKCLRIDLIKQQNSKYAKGVCLVEIGYGSPWYKVEPTEKELELLEKYKGEMV